MGVDPETCCICGDASNRGYYCSGDDCNSFFCRYCDGEHVGLCPDCELKIECEKELDNFTIEEINDNINILKKEMDDFNEIIALSKQTEKELKKYKMLRNLKNNLNDLKNCDI